MAGKMLTTWLRQSGYFAYFFASAGAVPVIHRDGHTSRNSQRLTLSTPNLRHNAMRRPEPDRCHERLPPAGPERAPRRNKAAARSARPEPPLQSTPARSNYSDQGVRPRTDNLHLRGKKPHSLKTAMSGGLTADGTVSLAGTKYHEDPTLADKLFSDAPLAAEQTSRLVGP